MRAKATRHNIKQHDIVFGGTVKYVVEKIEGGRVYLKPMKDAQYMFERRLAVTFRELERGNFRVVQPDYPIKTYRLTPEEIEELYGRD